MAIKKPCQQTTIKLSYFSENYTMYEEWTECTATCGGGYTFRVRECTDLTGTPDCEESEMKKCNEQACSSAGEVGERKLRLPVPPGVPTTTSG